MYKKSITDFSKDVQSYIKELSNGKCGIFISSLRNKDPNLIYIILYIIEHENDLHCSLLYDFSIRNRIELSTEIKIKKDDTRWSINDLILDFIHSEEEYDKFLKTILQDIKVFYFEKLLKNKGD